MYPNKWESWQFTESTPLNPVTYQKSLKKQGFQRWVGMAQWWWPEQNTSKLSNPLHWASESKGLLQVSGILKGEERGTTNFTPSKMAIVKHAVDDTYGKRKGQTQQWGKLVYTSVCSFQLYQGSVCKYIKRYTREIRYDTFAYYT